MKNAKSSLYSLESRIFDKGGAPGRFLVSAVRSLANRRLQKLSTDSDGDYVNAQAEGVIVSPVPHRTNFRLVRSRVVDRWFGGYVPKPGDIVLDVGAGTGEETVVFAKQVGTQGRVFSFEANPVMARCLSKTVKRSGLTNVGVVAAAVFDQPGKVSIADTEARARNSLLAKAGTKTVEVPALTLDDFVEENRIQTVDLLKMNIEGAERPALLGFRKNFDRVRNVVIDCHDWIADLGHSDGYRTLGFVREFLETRGFELKRRLGEPLPYIEFTVYGSARIKRNMLRSIKSVIPLRWKREAKRIISPLRPPADFPANDGPRLIVALAADYANLGDVSLTRALIRFAGRHLPSHQPYMLFAGRIFRDLRGVADAADNGDVVAIVGGGNMGDRYSDLEEARCHVVRAFPRNRIISFPQSFDFSDTPAGQRALAHSRAAYESHPRLQLFARESESLHRMRAAFPDCKVSMAPDTVLSLDLVSSAPRNLPLLVCLRQDDESSLYAHRRAAIVGELCNFASALIMDTVVPGPRLSFPEYEQHLDALWERFAHAKCVVTDRLHGLIFSVISRTPCVVIANNNHKIRSTMETWLSGLPSVRFLSNPEPAAVIAAVRELGAMPAASAPLNGAFTPLTRALAE